LFFERPQSVNKESGEATTGELAVLVHLEFPVVTSFHAPDPQEFRDLVLSAGGRIAAFLTGHRPAPDPRYFVGTGKLDEIKQEVDQSGSVLVIFDHTLSPSQERNLEKFLCCRVLDRTGLIFDIFAQRARTHEGKLQVELAQLHHASTRLVRGWTHLERQRGGIGLRGPGETQLETDRRLIRGRIHAIEKRLEKVRSQREQGRRSRTRSHIPTVALVGYTNAGKSTLFNRLTAADVYVANQLFATLDPTMRRIKLTHFGPYNVGEIILADTVGFISHLPHQLVEAFRATLEEVVNADLLLHVADSNHADRDLHHQEVIAVLEEIGAQDVPMLEVMNKIDAREGKQPAIDRDADGKPLRVWLSALSSDGIPLLLSCLDELLGHDVINTTLHLVPGQFGLRAELFRMQVVASEEIRDDGSANIAVKMPKKDLLSLLKQHAVAHTLS
jgi:GTP-binding protein HflX